jgi:hypothetical protein
MYTKLAAILMLAMAGTGASAATVFQDTFEGNDPFPNELQGTPALAKCDQEVEGVTGATSCTVWEDGGAPGDYADAFEVIYQDEVSFDWAFDPTLVTGADPVLYPALIAVKAGNEYATFTVDAGDLFGSASIAGILPAAISHVSFYDTGAPSVIPLPAGVWLLLGGLGGLAALRRKRAA